ncbi:hypothetical protein AA15669_0725 [Saccharibacter floricola DSM 15669]|uniref:Transposase n=1 Tax=Saccharibacter floricola DSM 15669 TaxID=1123227 RepID=A0ABQ0NYB0_9PROT|nr:hypothetical protein AA15669_0725 [Saccharibacter floricola DSM 15669]
MMAGLLHIDEITNLTVRAMIGRIAYNKNRLGRITCAEAFDNGKCWVVSALNTKYKLIFWIILLEEAF